MKSSTVWRLRLVALLMFIGGLSLITKLFFVTVVRGEYYADEATLQVTGDKSLFNRGSIFFSEKNGNLVSVATLQNGYTLAINPSMITEPEGLFDKLASLVTLDKDLFFKRASKKNDPYEEVATRLTEEQARAIKNLKESGIILAPTRWRFYPAGERASQVVGFVGYEKDELTGLYGLEQQYNAVLKRKPALSFSDFFSELFSNVGNGFVAAIIGNI